MVVMKVERKAVEKVALSATAKVGQRVASKVVRLVWNWAGELGYWYQRQQVVAKNFE